MPNSVDTSLIPHPTGAAAKYAAKHEDEHPLKLYGGWFCPFVQRSWITLHEKNIPHQYVEINPYHKAPEFLALNPRGLVPTLAVPVGGEGKQHKPLYESVVLCEYLDEAYVDEKDHGPRLLPEDVYERARCRLWIDHVCTKIVPGFYKMIQHTPDKAYTIEDARKEFLGNIKTWVKEMDARGPWFLGPRFSLVDIMLAPWAKRLFLIDHYKPGGVGIQEAKKYDPKTWERWQTWYEAILDRQSLRDTASSDDKYIEAYKRYAEDTTGSLVGQATRSGNRLP
ncbi:glutathione S-transferase [Cryphonectria parasitica EP155]|uniref:Glutathione S-transferase n=1 Tax=Cryphonectria parasitica (strain ATCC 38755 / EP155) TaxID=660469 RepID=A0A9P4XZH5_CRYP1|nr:glutathione S-transferase [Cryphonectria parasitica EP155]KAF3764199.1 glutathione S-transferase [Cryphonectria parasitica EP155]